MSVLSMMLMTTCIIYTRWYILLLIVNIVWKVLFWSISTKTSHLLTKGLRGVLLNTALEVFLCEISFKLPVNPNFSNIVVTVIHKILVKPAKRIAREIESIMVLICFAICLIFLLCQSSVLVSWSKKNQFRYLDKDYLSKLL